MATFKIKNIYRDKIETKYGEKERINIIAEEDSVTDVNGDAIDLTLPEGKKKRISGFRDKLGETDKWEDGMEIRVQIATRTTEKDDGTKMEWINFRMPEGKSSIVNEEKPSAPSEPTVEIEEEDPF